MFILSVLYELQCSQVSGDHLDDAYNQRKVLIDQFQNALMNSSENLFTLQKAFIFPQKKDSQTDGLYLSIRIILRERVTDSLLVSQYCNK